MGEAPSKLSATPSATLPRPPTVRRDTAGHDEPEERSAPLERPPRLGKPPYRDPVSTRWPSTLVASLCGWSGPGREVPAGPAARRRRARGQPDALTWSSGARWMIQSARFGSRLRSRHRKRRSSLIDSLPIGCAHGAKRSAGRSRLALRTRLATEAVGPPSERKCRRSEAD